MSRFGKFLMVVLWVMMLTTSVFAQNSASTVDNYTTIASDGSCEVSLTLDINLDTPASGLTFAVPKEAKNVTLNGSSVRTKKSSESDDVVLADLSYLDGITGTYKITFRYTLPDVISREKVEESETRDEKYKLMLNLPLLSGFDYPVETMSFTVTVPGAIENQQPTFYSGYYQRSIESGMEYTVSNNTITGTVSQQLKDKETMTMSLEVPQDMFPGETSFEREGNPEVKFMIICGGLALVYWLVFLRTGPIMRGHQTIPLEGVTAGEMGSRLTMAGADLTMMVFTWATLGYLRIHVDKRGRVLLYKRMEMGNERTAFENKCFHSLFGRKNVVDATGVPYARLCLKVAKTVSGIQEMYRRRAGNVKIFRILVSAVSVLSGICLAMNMVSSMTLQVILAVVLAVLGAVIGWNIQEGVYRIHIRGKLPLYIGSASVLAWMMLGALAGQPMIALGAVAVQIVGGFLAAYGGRRSDLGKYNASQVLGLRYFMKHVSSQELRHAMDLNPDYFFEMVPYAIALGVDGAFARQFGRHPQPPCPYLTEDRSPKRNTQDWAQYLRKVADMMDARQRKMQLEKFVPITIRKR